jgi:predicted ATP-dependent endonuclease of OLD family
MKIVKVAIEKFKVLKGIESNLEGRNVLLLGDNGVGKSSFIQFIKIALGYKDHLPDLEEGKGYVVTNKDGKEYTFYLNYKGGKPQLKVKTSDGVIDDRKSVIASIVGEVDFDIDEFVQWSESTDGRKKQVQTYKSFLDQDVREELEQLERQIQFSYDERTERNRAAKSLKGALEEHQMKYKDLVDSEVDVTALTLKISEGNEHNNKVSYVNKGVEDAKSNKTMFLEQIEELKRKVAEEEEKISKGEEWLSKNKVIDLSEISRQINESSEHNKKYNLSLDYKKKQSEFKELMEEIENLTIVIEGSRQAVSDAIKDMNVVDGLSFDFDGLIYNGVPVTPTNLSTSEIMELGVKIKMHANKELGILFIERAESLGTKRLESIYNMAKENGWQVIMEQVDRGKEELEIMIEGE